MVSTTKSKTSYPKVLSRVLILAAGLIIIVGLFLINIAPFRAFGGAIWLKSGPHYMGGTQIVSRTEQLNVPQETAMAEKIKSATPSCDSTENGFCQMSPGEYVMKTLTKSAVAYVPGTPDRQELIGYCTWCNDQSWSPSCAVGRGACSYHRGVASYNVPRYRTIAGTAAVQAQPAVYGYESKTYKDSPVYSIPTKPSLNVVVGY